MIERAYIQDSEDYPEDPVVGGFWLTCDCTMTLDRVAAYHVLYAVFGPALGYGRHRIVFADDNWVYKLPHHEDGEEANAEEERLSREKRRDFPVAYCTFVEILGVEVLKMERVKRLTKEKEYPSWVWNVDCEQVGYNSAGQLVAFDFSYI